MLKKLISFVNGNKALDIVTNSTGSTSFFKTLIEVYKEGKKTDLEIEQLRLKKEVLLKEMEQRHDLYNKIFTEIFVERRMAIQKYFEIIDRGLAENNRELINMGLFHLSQIVTTSPFFDINSLSKKLESNEIIEI
ncbi:hypothetical protein [Fusobacterium necrophorum]|uniref:hypothetical protein n=1 Tax=Fusobacterium necrophorum TaxID=859 RepID=UPI0007878694|nr:hypothetical protein [Fusobacterium necrophorum]KYM38812.1 hypothetical protein A2U15_03070 [Fusobacterium necrophorum subsp. funduliforme]